MKILPLGLVVCLLAVACSQDVSQKAKALDPANMDLTVSPGEDFFQYANGTWMKNNPLPAEYSRYGSFEMVREKNWEDLRSIFEDAAQSSGPPEGSNIKKIGDFYASGMDSEKIEADGFQPLQEELDRIDAIQTSREVQEQIARMHSYGGAGYAGGLSPLFGFFSEQDQLNSQMVIAWLYQGGLGLPDRDYYMEESDRAKEIRTKYVEHIQKMFELMGEIPEEAKKKSEVVMAIETRLAAASMTLLEQRDPKAITNKMPLTQLQEISKDYDWGSFFASVGVGDPGELNVSQPNFFKEVGRMMKETGAEDWKIYLRWNLIDSLAPYLSSDFVNQNFAFFSKFLRGQQEIQPRWKRVLSRVSLGMGEAVGQVYVEKYFPPEAKTRMFELVMNLKVALKLRIEQLEWMSAETKDKALAKLESFGVKVGYPDEWVDYSALDIDSSSYVGNVLRAWNFAFSRDIEKINQPVDRKEWKMYPQTVNAYYNPNMNEIVFPAAILQPPFFWLESDDAVNYGAVGAVIGHEMTHGFDDQGRQYDLEGNLNDWWTEEDGEKFVKRAEVLVKQYDDFFVLDDLKVNGKLTLGENIADLGGLSVALDALEIALEEKPEGTIDGFTPTQRFLLSWAQLWRANISEENLRLRVKTDVHSPAVARVNGPFKNIPEFYAVFGVKEGDSLYLPEEQRAKIW